MQGAGLPPVGRGEQVVAVGEVPVDEGPAHPGPLGHRLHRDLVQAPGLDECDHGVDQQVASGLTTDPTGGGHLLGHGWVARGAAQRRASNVGMSVRAARASSTRRTGVVRGLPESWPPSALAATRSNASASATRVS